MSSLHSLEAFKNTFRDLKDHGPTTLTAAAILSLPLLAAGVVGALLPFGAIRLATQATLTLVGYFFSYVWLPVAVITATYHYATGSSPGVGGLLATSFRGGPLLRYLGVLILIGLILLGILIVIAIPIVGTAIAILAGSEGNILRAFTSPAGAVLAVVVILGILVFLVIAIIVTVRLAVAGVASVLEGARPVASLRRSDRLITGHRWDALLGLVLLVGVGSLLGLVIGGPALMANLRAMAEFSSGQIPMRPGFFPSAGGGLGVVSAVSTFLLATINGAITATFWANFYLSLRGEEAMTSPISPRAEPGPPGGDGEGYPGEQQQTAGEDEGAGDLGEHHRGDQG